MESLFGITQLAVTYLFIKSFWLMSCTEEHYFNREFARALPNKDFSKLGSCDVFTYHSLRIWCYSVEVILYQKEIEADIYTKFINWNSKYNIDADSVLYNAIDTAHTNFLLEVNNAHEEKREPRFIISTEFNYHNLPKSLRYNDYVDMERILKIVDDILEGNNGKCS